MKNKILKVILIALLTVVTYGTKSGVYAALEVNSQTSFQDMYNEIYTQGKGYLAITEDDVKNNVHLFCRHKGKSFSGNSYGLDSGIGDNGKSIHQNDAWAYLFSNATSYTGFINNYYEGNHSNDYNAQYSFWMALNWYWDENHGKESIEELNGGINTGSYLTKEASAYNSVGQKLSQYNKESQNYIGTPSIIINKGTTNNTLNIKVGRYNNDNQWEPYPFAKVDYGTTDKQNKLIGGISQFYVYYIDNNGNKCHIPYTFNNTTYNEQSFISNNNAGIISLNEQNNNGGINITLNENIGVNIVYVKVAYKTLSTWANIYYLTATNSQPVVLVDYGKTGDEYYVEDSIQPQKQIELIKLDAITRQTMSGVSFYGTISNINSCKYKNTEYYASNGVINFEKIETDENGKIILDDVVVKDNTSDVIILLTENETPGYESIGQIEIKLNGKNFTNSGSLSQNVSINTKQEEQAIKTNITIENTPIVVPRLHLEKYNLSEDLKLSGAKFTISAIQNNKNIDIKDSNSIKIANPITLPADGLDLYFETKDIKYPLNINLVETEAPNGYECIKETINITYTYNNKKNSWELKYDKVSLLNDNYEGGYIKFEKDYFQEWYEEYEQGLSSPQRDKILLNLKAWYENEEDCTLQEYMRSKNMEVYLPDWQGYIDEKIQAYLKSNETILWKEGEKNETETSYISREGDIIKVNSIGIVKVFNKEKLISISGKVWLDEQNGIKPARPYDGIMGEGEQKLSGIRVSLYRKNTKGEFEHCVDTETNLDGKYCFENYPAGYYYYVQFGYNGICYETTHNIEETKILAEERGIDTTGIEFLNNLSYAVETERENFNNQFKEITYNTNTEYSAIFAKTDEQLINTNVTNLNLGLRQRGIDLALTTDLVEIITENGKEYAKCKVSVKNQSVEDVRKANVDVFYDENIITINKSKTEDINKSISYKIGNLNFDITSIAAGESISYYLIFDLKQNTDTLINAEIAYYETWNGLVDKDSKPGNYEREGKVEDDNDTLEIKKK